MNGLFPAGKPREAVQGFNARAIVFTTRLAITQTADVGLKQ
jgi:hypothetical protein